MKKETFKKAEKLTNEIEFLETFISDLRPQFANGVGLITSNRGVGKETKYKYNLWKTTPDCKEIKSQIMNSAIIATHTKAKELLIEKEKELKLL